MIPVRAAVEKLAAGEKHMVFHLSRAL
jgi:hypothetical protein